MVFRRADSSFEALTAKHIVLNMIWYGRELGGDDVSRWLRKRTGSGGGGGGAGGVEQRRYVSTMFRRRDRELSSRWTGGTPDISRLL